tara:strand:- start:1030 stop:1500 length:471 start_codon:yes stop_codon:yes gene_type:complete
MLEYVAAANAAYSVIKSAVQNGRELHSVASHIGKFTDAKDQLQNKASKKRNSIWSNFTGKDESDLEEFMHLEELKQKENELKQMMIYLGRPGLHSDYVKFCVEARKRRQEDAKERARKWEELKENILLGILWFLGIAVLCAVTFGTVYVLRKRGIV